MIFFSDFYIFISLMNFLTTNLRPVLLFKGNISVTIDVTIKLMYRKCETAAVMSVLLSV